MRNLLTRIVAAGCAFAVAAAPVLVRADPVHERRKIAVLDVSATGNLAPKAVEGLSALIASEVGRLSGCDVLGGSDIRSMVGFERQRQLLGCNDTGCLAEIGGALGVDFIVGSEVSVVGSTYLLSLSLVDIRRTRVVSRLTKTTKDDDDLVPMTQEAVRELLASLPPEKSETAAALASPVPTEVTAATGSPAPRKRSALPALLLIGVGGAAAVGGGLLLLDAVNKRADYIEGTDSSPSLSSKEADDLKKKGEASRNIGFLALGGGAVIALVGVLLLPGGDDGAKVAVGPGRGGGAFVSASFPIR